MTDTQATEFDDRMRFFAEAAEVTPFLGVVDTNGSKFIVPTSDEAVGRSLFVKRSRGEYRTLEAALAGLDAAGRAKRLNGTTFLDIGANIGTTTIAALLLNRGGSSPFAGAIACEPEPGNVRLLKLNALLNDVDQRVRVLPVALSDKLGTGRLLLHPTNAGAHSVRTGKMETKGFEEIGVEQETFDHLVERGLVDPEAIGLVWMDVQGHEGHVLKGAESLVSRGVPVVFEFYPRMLRRAGGLTKLHSVVRDHYTHFADLRSEGVGKATLRPVKELKEYGAQLGKPGVRIYTDILAMRLKPARR